MKIRWYTFGAICLIIIFYLSVKLWSLMPIYFNVDLRNNVQSQITEVSEQEGWLLSGISIQSVSSESVQLTYTSYVRGEDNDECFNLSLSDPSLSPCLK